MAEINTASLLIGLLGAANIPARYVYGTIQIPADRTMNWVGGVTKPEAAQQLMGQGGIPNTWVPMDASYKQYTYTQGMDIKGQVPLDAQALITQAQTGATVESAGWVQNINGVARRPKWLEASGIKTAWPRLSARGLAQRPRA